MIHVAGLDANISTAIAGSKNYDHTIFFLMRGFCSISRGYQSPVIFCGQL